MPTCATLYDALRYSTVKGIPDGRVNDYVNDLGNKFSNLCNPNRVREAQAFFTDTVRPTLLDMKFWHQKRNQARSDNSEFKYMLPEQAAAPPPESTDTGFVFGTVPPELLQQLQEQSQQFSEQFQHFSQYSTFMHTMLGSEVSSDTSYASILNDMAVRVDALFSILNRFEPLMTRFETLLPKMEAILDTNEEYAQHQTDNNMADNNADHE